NASSACPQGPTNSDSPAASAVPGPRAGTTDSTSTTDPTSDFSGAAGEGLEGLPEIPPYAEVGALDARALSKTLFERLESLEEGTHEYSYVRNTLVELNLALVKFAAS
ncbi:RNA polymerase sigma factor SigF, partial [Streptomyces sp. SID7499]|nr:RNA polymerase sigma factor SigF [Streptomyces sp. SID7499]